tara:strand:+ start:495 stop:767 length:273 start_codon:yes stop_codon:yes gene_type:complete
MPKQNVPKYTNQSVSHHQIGFNIKRPKAIELDKKIEIIRKKLEKDRRQDYAEKVAEKIVNGEKNWYVPHNHATRGQVLEVLINYYLDNVQ